MQATIKRVKLNGASKGINYHRHYKVELSNGHMLTIETNEDATDGKKFHLGNGESSSTIWFKDIKGIVRAYNADPSFDMKTEKPKNVPMVTKYNETEGILTINGKYEYMDVSPFIKRRVEKILNGDSPNRVWALLKKFAVNKIAE